MDAVKPDIILGCETWLKPGITQGEIFPPEFSLYRKDRSDGYGGVLIGVHRSLISHQIDIDTDAEFIAVKILNGDQNIIVASAYRPTDNNQQYIDSLNQAITDLCLANRDTAVWIGGDFNLPDVKWSTNEVIGHQYRKSISESVLHMLANVGMEQMVDFPTRGDRTLDLIFTNRPSLVNVCEGLPALSDHDVVFLDMYAKAQRQKPVRWKIYLWKRVDLESLRSDAVLCTNDFVLRYSSNTPVEILATSLQQELEQLMEKHVPSKLSTTRFNQPWFNSDTKRVCRRKARAFRKARHTNKRRDWLRFRRLKKSAQLTCRQSYNNYLTEIICSEPGGNKKLGALIKAKRFDQSGVAPLKDGGFVHSDPKTKANILNRQFSAVFTDEGQGPLPDIGTSPHPSMDDIVVSCAGVVKLLENLKPHKAGGPDGLPARLLKELAEEIAPAVTLLFQTSINQGRVPSV